MANERLTVYLDTKYDPKGLAQMRADLLRLKQVQINAMASGGGFSNRNKAEMATLQTNISTMQKKQATAQKNVLISGLGVMFFMMSLNKVFMDIASPAAEISGIFEIISLIFTLLMLPVMLKLIPVLLSVLSAISALPEEVKLLAGGFILLGVVITSILGFVAQLALGLSSLGVSGALISVFTGALGTLAAILTSPIALVVGLTAAIVAMIAYREQISSFFTELGDHIANLLGIGQTSKEREATENIKTMMADTSAIRSLPVVGGPLADIADLSNQLLEGAASMPLLFPQFALGKGAGEFAASKIMVALNINNSAGIQSEVTQDQLGSSDNAESAVFLNSTG